MFRCIISEQLQQNRFHNDRIVTDDDNKNDVLQQCSPKKTFESKEEIPLIVVKLSLNVNKMFLYCCWNCR